MDILEASRWLQNLHNLHPTPINLSLDRRENLRLDKLRYDLRSRLVRSRLSVKFHQLSNIEFYQNFVSVSSRGLREDNRLGAFRSLTLRT